MSRGLGGKEARGLLAETWKSLQVVDLGRQCGTTVEVLRETLFQAAEFCAQPSNAAFETSLQRLGRGGHHLQASLLGVELTFESILAAEELAQQILVWRQRAPQRQRFLGSKASDQTRIDTIGLIASLASFGVVENAARVDYRHLMPGRLAGRSRSQAVGAGGFHGDDRLGGPGVLQHGEHLGDTFGGVGKPLMPGVAVVQKASIQREFGDIDAKNWRSSRNKDRGLSLRMMDGFMMRHIEDNNARKGLLSGVTPACVRSVPQRVRSAGYRSVFGQRGSGLGSYLIFRLVGPSR